MGLAMIGDCFCLPLPMRRHYLRLLVRDALRFSSDPGAPAMTLYALLLGRLPLGRYLMTSRF